MSRKLEFKIVVEDGGKQVFSQVLSYESVASIVSNCRDHPENSDFFALAASHPASTVREAVAYKDNISEETVNQLSDDQSIAVLRSLVRSKSFKDHASHDAVEKLVSRDVEVAQNVASDFDSYENVNSDKICAALADLSDPSISYFLAGNYSSPKKLLKRLVDHKDPHVASEARVRLDG